MLDISEVIDYFKWHFEWEIIKQGGPTFEQWKKSKARKNKNKKK
jgi:hypothetical protein